MEEEKDKLPASGGTLEEAISSLDGQTPSTPTTSIFDSPTLFPPPSKEDEDKQPPTTDLSFTERINLEESLFKTRNEEIMNCAADSLVDIAETDGCTIVHMRRILDILTYRNRDEDGAFSGQLRKIRRIFDSRRGSTSEHDADFIKRDTLPYPGKALDLGPRPQPARERLPDRLPNALKGKAKR
ncbi:hypothetical protein GF412_03545 [Candidatus Micrarchaeota archaeon]|nr:hypothetical protein [Candidatus Micrarchaeota archaeon]MBD3418025.1 hypothetical protein [Candidatus Micrarchaeota archaeon]